jgi:hypothetical protein
VLGADQDKSRTVPQGVGRAGSTSMGQPGEQDVKDRYQSIT